MGSGENSKTMKSQSDLSKVELDDNNFQNKQNSKIQQVNVYEDIQPLSDGGISQNDFFIIPPPRSADDIIDKGKGESFNDKNEGQDTSQQDEESQANIKVATKPLRRLFSDDQLVYEELVIPKNIVPIYAKKTEGSKTTQKRIKLKKKPQYLKKIFLDVLKRMKNEFKK